jgi:hypothetical protein
MGHAHWQDISRAAKADSLRIWRGELLLKTVLAHFGLLVCADA